MTPPPGIRGVCASKFSKECVQAPHLKAQFMVKYHHVLISDNFYTKKSRSDVLMVMSIMTVFRSVLMACKWRQMNNNKVVDSERHHSLG
jgi:DnaJ-domain-containing protein 1